MPARTMRRAAMAALVVAVTAQVLRWRRRRRGPADVRSIRQLDLPGNPTGTGVVLTVNPGSGSSGGQVVDELRKRLPDAEIVELDDPGDLDDVLDGAARRSGTVAVGAAGGDGTINAAAAVAARHRLPLVAVPAGTLNHLARDVGLEDVGDAIDAVTLGTAAEVDLATIAGRPFLNTASFGLYTDLVDAREAWEDRIGKWPAAAVAALRVLREGEPVEVVVDGRVRRLWMAFVGNCRYQPDGFAPSRRERLDDGQLDVRLIDAAPRWSRARVVVGLLTGRLGRSAVYEQWATTSLVLQPSGAAPLRLATDGETFDAPSDVDVIEVAKGGGRVAVYSRVRGSGASAYSP